MPKTAPFHLRLPRYSHLQPLARVFSFTFTISFKLESFRCSLNPTKTPTRLTFLDHVSDPCTVPSFSSLFSSSSTRKSFNSRGLHLRGMFGSKESLRFRAFPSSDPKLCRWSLLLQIASYSSLATKSRKFTWRWFIVGLLQATVSSFRQFKC